MTTFSTPCKAGGGNLGLLIPAAIPLGALHGLEPGDSKTMMAAFIVAIRGAVWHVVLLRSADPLLIPALSSAGDDARARLLREIMGIHDEPPAFVSAPKP